MALMGTGCTVFPVSIIYSGLKRYSWAWVCKKLLKITNYPSCSVSGVIPKPPLAPHENASSPDSDREEATHVILSKYSSLPALRLSGLLAPLMPSSSPLLFNQVEVLKRNSVFPFYWERQTVCGDKLWYSVCLCYTLH